MIGCAMKVHGFMGPGFPERYYERCLLIEMEKNGLDCAQQMERAVYYHDQLIGKRRLDILVEGKVLLELKAITILDNSAYNKLCNYLKIFDIPVGLLLNFGASSLQFRRFANTRNQRNLQNQ